MKKLFATVALATLVATPVLAQSYTPGASMGNIGPAPYSYAQTDKAFDAFAQAPRAHVRAQSQVREPDVIDNSDVVRDSQGNVVGEDPDANIRSQLQRDNQDTEW
jgi:hypothetical protein